MRGQANAVQQDSMQLGNAQRRRKDKDRMQSDNLDQIDTHHVLVINSDDRILTRTSELLESAGFQVSTADMPDIGILRRIEPDVMVVGIFFRDQPAGLTFLEHNLTDPMLAKFPVVIQG